VWGGSAGGVEACIKLLQNFPPDFGVAIVVVKHLTITPTILH
jgi:chemotaxis response regulator CheB